MIRPHKDSVEVGPPPHDWWPDWTGQTVALIGAGPSASSAGVDQLKGRAKVIAINESFRLTPWADMLYGCDHKWWKIYNFKPAFAGLKITFDRYAAINFPPLKYITVEIYRDDILCTRGGLVGSGGCSGFQALNLAVQFGARRILLVGFDMNRDMDAHWHGRHKPPLANPDYLNYERWMKSFGRAFEKLATMGIEVINCSEASALTTYPKMSIRRALEQWKLAA